MALLAIKKKCIKKSTEIKITNSEKLNEKEIKLNSRKKQQTKD